MKIAFDIGGVCTAYEETVQVMVDIFRKAKCEIYFITDMQNKGHATKMAARIWNSTLPLKNVLIADVKTHGTLAKAKLLKEHNIDVFFDDNLAYVQWDSTFGKAPMRLLVMPDISQPYADKSWGISDQHRSFKELSNGT